MASSGASRLLYYFYRHGIDRRWSGSYGDVATALLHITGRRTLWLATRTHLGTGGTMGRKAETWDVMAWEIIWWFR